MAKKTRLGSSGHGTRIKGDFTLKFPVTPTVGRKKHRGFLRNVGRLMK